MILIIGAGFVGGRVASLLHEAGTPITAVTHSAESAAKLAEKVSYPVLTTDVGDEISLGALSAQLAAPPTQILHCASTSRGGVAAYQRVFVEGCRNLLQTFPSASLFFTSSTSVYPQTDGTWVTEESSADPTSESGKLLRQAEDDVLSHGGTVARLAGIYGPGRAHVLKSFLEGTAAIERNEGQGRYLNQVHGDDAAAALVHLMTEKLPGIYNVGDDLPMTQRECFEELAHRFQKPLPGLAEPNPARKRAWTHKRVSNAKLRESEFTLTYSSFFDALDGDAVLVPSILAQVANPADAPNRES